MRCTHQIFQQIWNITILFFTIMYIFPLPYAQSQMASAHYRIEPQVFGASGGQSNSINFAHGGSFGQPVTVGTSSSPRYIVQSGFWSFAGSGLVPVILTVKKDTNTSDAVILEWSGNNPPYQIYRSTDCSAIFNSYLTSTPSNTYTDMAPPSGLSCYNVLATAPGIRAQNQSKNGGKR